MFVDAIETAAQFTRPICTISRIYGTATAIPGSATLFIVNSEGWALTCRHVAEAVITANEMNNRYERFKAEKAAIPPGKKYRHHLEILERNFGYQRDALSQMFANFVDCVDTMTDLGIHLHPKYDLALIKFTGFRRLYCEKFPVFATDGDGLKQGRSLCRLGFPFPEFSNYEYDSASDNIRWNAAGAATPRFPLEGMVTRHIGDAAGDVFGFEMSTPGLRGQSGGPAFDTEGRVWGMQSSTKHLDLDFDVDIEVLRGGRRKRVTNSPFLHVGNCIHVNVLKSFMRSMGVKFQEG